MRLVRRWWERFVESLLFRALVLVVALGLAAAVASESRAVSFETTEAGFYDGSETAFVFPASSTSAPFIDPISGITLTTSGFVDILTSDIGVDSDVLVDLPIAATRVGFGLSITSAGTITFEPAEGMTTLASMAFDFTAPFPPEPQDFVGVVAGPGELITSVLVVGTVPTFGGAPSFNIDDLRFEPVLQFETTEAGFYSGNESAFVFPQGFPDTPYTDPVSGMTIDTTSFIDISDDDLGIDSDVIVDLPSAAERVGFSISGTSAGMITFEAFSGSMSLGAMPYTFTAPFPPEPQDFVGVVSTAGDLITRVEVVGTVPTFGGAPSFNIDDFRFESVPEPVGSAWVALGTVSLIVWWRRRS